MKKLTIEFWETQKLVFIIVSLLIVALSFLFPAYFKVAISFVFAYGMVSLFGTAGWVIKEVYLGSRSKG